MAVDRFDRRYVVVAPPWAEEYCTQNQIPFMPWGFARLNERSHELVHQLEDMGVDLFEEAHDRGDVVRFLKRVNQTLLKLDGDPDDPIHFKAFDKSGTAGHSVVRTPGDVDNIPDDEFPALLESHRDGWEFAVEAWLKDGKIQCLNISEYVTLG